MALNSQVSDLDDPKFEVVKIGGGQYRKVIIPEGLSFRCDVNRYGDEPEEEGEEGNEYHEADPNMEFVGDSWEYKLNIPAVFHKFLIGRQGKVKSQLEMQSGASINIPSREDQEEVIILKARQKQQIYSAKAQIELLCEKEESKLEYTHFLSIPLCTEAKVRQRIDQFQEDVILQRYDGVDKSIFMPSRRVHFTICMLKLHSLSQIDDMKKALAEAGGLIAAQPEFGIQMEAHLEDLHILTDDPSSVSVVHTTDRSRTLGHRINGIGDSLFAVLKSHGLVTNQNLHHQRLLATDGETAEIKLHATLMNTRYQKGPYDWQNQGDGRENKAFDASYLMERFGRTDFGTSPLKELQLSCLAEMGDDGYYKSLFNVPLYRQS